jgi:glycopeptide antibiotics resistance protein
MFMLTLIPRFLFPLLPYRSFFFPFLVLSAITVPCWLVFRLYRRRDREHATPVLREMVLLIFVIYLTGLAVATLIPNRNSRRVAETALGIDLQPRLASLTCSSATLRKGSTAQAFCVHNARGNVMLFFPLGILIPLIWTRLRFWRVMQIAAALSISIEIIQYFSKAWSNRSIDVNDVILNVAGAFLGLIIVSVLRLVLRPHHLQRSEANG